MNDKSCSTICNRKGSDERNKMKKKKHSEKIRKTRKSIQTHQSTIFLCIRFDARCNEWRTTNSEWHAAKRNECEWFVGTDESYRNNSILWKRSPVFPYQLVYALCSVSDTIRNSIKCSFFHICFSLHLVDSISRFAIH